MAKCFLLWCVLALSLEVVVLGHLPKDMQVDLVKRKLLDRWTCPEFEQLAKFPGRMLLEEVDFDLFDYLILQMLKTLISIDSSIETVSSDEQKQERIAALSPLQIQRLLLISFDSLADIDFENPPSDQSLKASKIKASMINTIAGGQLISFQPARNDRRYSSVHDVLYCEHVLPLSCGFSKQMVYNFGVEKMEEFLKDFNGGRIVLPILPEMMLSSNK